MLKMDTKSWKRSREGVGGVEVAGDQIEGIND